MKTKSAVFQDQWGHKSVITCDGDGASWADDHADYVRITESVEVEFPELDHQKVLEGQLAQIAAAEQKASGDYQHFMDVLDRRRQELLALPMTVEDPA